MTINIAKFFIEKPIFLISLTLALFISGVFSFLNLNRNEDPGFKIRTASILTSAPLYSVSDVDFGITRPIEEIIRTMDEIEDVKSESYRGRSVIYADLFEHYSDIQPVWDRLRRKIELSKNKIYDGLNPVVNDEYGDVFGVLIGVSKTGANYEELYDITRKIKDELYKLKSRGRVEIFGAVDEALYLNYKTSYLSNLKLATDDVKRFVDSINTVKTGGVIYSENDFSEINSTTFKNEDELKSKLFNLNGISVPFSSLFEVKKTIKASFGDEKIVKSNGKNALIIGISLKKDGNILSLGDEIKGAVKKLSEKYPDTNIEILSMQSDYVRYLTDKFTSGLFESILAVIFVVLLFLGFKTGLIIGFIILITIVSTFFAMNIFNIGLDKISLSALIISLGILVDNSIVISESAIRSGEITKENLILTVKKFQFPLFIVTISASMAFFPVFIAKSTVGEYASNLFRVVFIVLFFSWFYSVSLLPYLLLKFSSNLKINKNNFFITEFLVQKTAFVLKNGRKILVFSFFFFVLSIVLFSFVPKIFFPESDRNAYEIRLNLKNEVTLNKTKNAIEKVEEFLKTKKDVISYSSYIGTSAPRYVLSAAPEADRLNFGMILVNLKSYKMTDKNINEVKTFINKNVQEAQAVVRKIPLGPPVDAPVEIRIINNDIDKLFYFKNFVLDIISDINGVYLVKDNWGDFIPEYKIKINENAAIMAGISPDYLYDELSAIYNGKILTYYFRGDVKVPVILKADDEFLKNSSSINSISVYSKLKKSPIPISQIAQISTGYTFPKILRRNGAYVLTVQAWIDSTTNANKVLEIIIPKLNQVSGLEYEIGGEYEKSKKGNKSVTEKIPIAFLIIFLIFVMYFDSFKKPILIAISGFMALAGANVGLFITNSSFGFMTFLGYISLAGISMNNGVILLNEVKEDNEEEIIKAVQTRVEPILLTCFTTIGGMLSLWIKNDPMFSTLAVAIIFGLVFSVFITLFVLPNLYLLVSKNVKKLK